MRRAFSLTEVMVVVVVIGVASGLAASNISSAVQAAQARSQSLAAVRAVKLEKMRAGELMRPLAVRAAGDQIAFSRAVIRRDRAGNATGCTPGAQLDVRRFPALRLGMVGGTTLCLDDDGRPVTPGVAIAIDIDDDGDGALVAAERGTVTVNTAGIVEVDGAINKKKHGKGVEDDTVTKKTEKEEKKKGKKKHKDD